VFIEKDQYLWEPVAVLMDYNLKMRKIRKGKGKTYTMVPNRLYSK